jgi:hypothetical protein
LPPRREFANSIHCYSRADPKLGRALPAAEIRAEVLRAAKRAVDPASRPGPGLRGRIDRVFRSALSKWGVMDERKVESFYALAESAVDKWLAIPSGRRDGDEWRRSSGGTD